MTSTQILDTLAYPSLVVRHDRWEVRWGYRDGISISREMWSMEYQQSGGWTQVAWFSGDERRARLARRSSRGRVGRPAGAGRGGGEGVRRAGGGDAVSVTPPTHESAPRCQGPPVHAEAIANQGPVPGE